LRTWAGNALFKTYGWEYAQGAFPRLIKVLGSFVGPFLLKRIVSFVEDQSQSLWYGTALLFILFLATLLTSVALNRYWHLTVLTAMHVRWSFPSSPIIEMYLNAKPLNFVLLTKGENISGGTRLPKEFKAVREGQTKLVNRRNCQSHGQRCHSVRIALKNITPQMPQVKTDFVIQYRTRLQDTVFYLHFLWATPLLVIVCFILVSLVLGVVPTLAGYSVFVVMTPASFYITRFGSPFSNSLWNSVTFIS
jgi:hypothetical protein